MRRSRSGFAAAAVLLLLLTSEHGAHARRQRGPKKDFGEPQDPLGSTPRPAPAPVATTSFGGSVACTFHSDGLKQSPAESRCALASFAGRESVSGVDIVVPRGTRELRFGCELPAGSAVGRAVLVRRGECAFTVKAEQAARAGAAALFIISDDNKVPVVGGLPGVNIDFPVVLLSSSFGRKLRKAAIRTGATGDVVVTEPPSLAAWRLAETLVPRACSGRERVLVMSVGATADAGVTVTRAAGDGVSVAVSASAKEAARYLDRHALDPDIVVVLRAPSTPGARHLLAGDMQGLAARFCASDAAIVLAASPACDGCGSGARKAYGTGPYPSPGAFVTYTNVAKALLAAKESGVDVVEVMGTYNNATAVDALGDLMLDLGGASVDDAMGLSDGVAEVGADGFAEASSGQGRLLFAERMRYQRLSSTGSGTAASVLLNTAGAGPAALDAAPWLTAQDEPLRVASGPPATPAMLGGSEGVWCEACHRRFGRAGRKANGDRAVSPMQPFLHASVLADRADVVINSTGGDAAAMRLAVAQLGRVRAGDVVFVATAALPVFFLQLAQTIHQPYVLLSGAVAGDDATDDVLATVDEWTSKAESDPHMLGWGAMGLPAPVIEALPRGHLNAIPVGVSFPATLGAGAALAAAIASVPPVASPERKTLVCLDSSAVADRLLQRVDAASGEGVAQRVEATPGMARMQQLASCVFVAGAAAGGDDAHLDWDAIAMGAIPIVAGRKRQSTMLTGRVLTVQDVGSLTTGEMRAFQDGLLASAPAHDPSQVYAAPYLEAMGRHLTQRLNAMRHPSVVPQQEPLWEASWAVMAPHKQSEAAVYFPGRTPNVAACARLMDDAIHSGTPAVARTVYHRCMVAHATNHELLAAMGTARYAERQYTKAEQWWRLAAEHLRANGGHPARLAMLERRLAHVTEVEQRSTRRTQAQRSLGGPLPTPKNRFAVPLVFAVTTPSIPWYFADTLRQAHCTNPSAPIIVAALPSAWSSFSAAWGEDGADEWLTFMPTDLLRQASAAYDFFNTTSPYASSEQAEWGGWHASLERFFVLDALYAAGVLKPKQAAMLVDADTLLYSDLSAHTTKLLHEAAGIHTAFFNATITAPSLVVVRERAAIEPLAKWLGDRLMTSATALNVLREGVPGDARYLVAEYATDNRGVVGRLPTDTDTPTVFTGEDLFDGGQWGLFMAGSASGAPPGSLVQDNYLYRGITTRKHTVSWGTRPKTPFAVPKTTWCSGTPPHAMCQEAWLATVQHGHTPDASLLATCVRGGGPDEAFGEVDDTTAAAVVEAKKRTRLMGRALEFYERAYDHGGYDAHSWTTRARN